MPATVRATIRSGPIRTEDPGGLPSDGVAHVATLVGGGQLRRDCR